MMEYTMLIWLFGLCTIDIQATTHWMVTETGLIQPRVDSPFEMARPYDLVAFLNQDTRWENIQKLFKELSNRQIEINKLWAELEEDTDMNKWLNKDKNCKNTGQLGFLDWNAVRLEDSLSTSIPLEEYQLHTPSFGEDFEVPDCKKISSLTFSMFTFEHLEAMVNRENLSISAELSLPELIAPLMTVDQFGHWVATILRKNSSSWLHYNMASLYWRVRGNAPKALECSRRALHYASRKYKDIALLSMGTVLHRARRSEDAVVVLGAAVDHNPQCVEAHFVLAHAYAVLGAFNDSIKHYDETLKLNSGYDQAVKNRYGVVCVRELVKRLQIIHSKFLKLRSKLKEYAASETLWLKSQAAFLRTMKHNEEIDYGNIEKIVSKMSDITGLNIKELKNEGDKNSLIQYFLDGPLYNEKWFSEKTLAVVEAAYGVQRLIKHIAKHANMASEFIAQPDLVKIADGQIKKEIGPMPVMPELGRPDFTWLSKTSDGTKAESQPKDKPRSKSDDETYQFEMGLPLYPPTMKVSRGIEDFDRDPEWPPEQACKDSRALTFGPENLETIYAVFLPFENKGLRLKGLLTERIGVGVHAEHELPWHPPACLPGKDAIAIQRKAQKQQLLPEVIPTDYLRQRLLEYVGDGHPGQVAQMQDAEIGQRIFTAMESNVAPKWLVYTLASLYWRVRGNNANALSCLLTASKNVRVRYKDVVLTSLASVYLEMGLYDEALSAADEAFKLSMYEPATNFLLYQLNMLKKQRNSQMFHLKQTVRVEGNFLNGIARQLLVAWSCMLKHAAALHSIDFAEGDVCTEVQPGVSMVCSKGNVNCHIANIQCFTHNEKESTSTFVRLMEIKKDDPVQAERVDESVFEPFIQRMPLEQTDKEGHTENLNKMVAILDGLKGCGAKGCRKIKAAELNLKEEDCSYQYLQLGYWLHIISFRQLISDHELRLPPEIAALPPSAKKVPECRIYGDPSQDLFLERVLRVDSEGWQPVLSLMHQLADLFHRQEYSQLGAKFAKYIDTRPVSWRGALGAGWWCGAAGRGGCARLCLAAALSLAPPTARVHPLRALVALLHAQDKAKDALDIAHLTFYLSPKSKTEAFLVAVSRSYQEQFDQAVWMYRYALTFDENYLPAKACLHAAMCMMLFSDGTSKIDDSIKDEL